MNANEALASLAGDGAHPTTSNMGKSFNDVFPSAVHLAALGEVTDHLLPAMGRLEAPIAGSRSWVTWSRAARWTAEGKTSFDDWPMLTWSLGWAPSPARLASTSLAFMFEEVPEPVWKTSIGNWSSCSPAATASPASANRSATPWSSRRARR